MSRVTANNRRPKGSQPNVITDDRPVITRSHDDEKPSASAAEQAADMNTNLEAKYAPRPKPPPHPPL